MGEVCRGSGTNYECYLSPTRVPQGQASYFPTDEERSGRSANNEGCSQVIQLLQGTNSGFSA